MGCDMEDLWGRSTPSTLSEEEESRAELGPAVTPLSWPSPAPEGLRPGTLQQASWSDPRYNNHASESHLYCGELIQLDDWSAREARAELDEDLHSFVRGRKCRRGKEDGVEGW